MRAQALIVAAGRGSRAGDGPPKPYRPLNGRCSLARAVAAFAAHPGVERIRCVIRSEDAALYAAAVAGFAEALDPWVLGGAERQDSVRLGLEEMAKDAPDVVLIHDAARPFLSADVIDRALAALEGADAACAALPVADTLRRGEGGVCGDLVDREGLWRAQTPQAFRFETILAAHRAHAGATATDDAELARLAGVAVTLFDGAPENLKLTRPEDFGFAEAWARGVEGVSVARAPRVGHGYDVHRFGPNADGSSDHVVLCGLKVPHETGLVGHSDADVGLHVLTDAILGAIAEGDIGTHFPPSDPQWKGAPSERFLRFAVGLAGAKGGEVAHLDLTLICERPKIGPHVAAMRARIAEITGLAPERVSVKATTTEGLGFTGRGEGIAATATATVLL